MSKKLICLAIAIMLWGFGLAGCVDSLDNYKADAKLEIQAHADTKRAENSYTAEGLVAIEQAVTAGEKAVDEATDKPKVRTARDNTKAAINAVSQEGEEVENRFFDLDEAYEKGWLTQDDLKSIAFYYRGTGDDNFVPMPKTPANLSDATELKIKQLYLDDLRKKVPEATLEEVRISYYYGTYGDCVVVKVWDDIVDYDLYFIPEHFIGGVLFRDYCAREIYIWKTK